MLFIKDLREEDSGTYRCSGIYATNEEMHAQVDISTFIGITWDDAPTEQNAVINTDYKIRCVVLASPPATIDWLKESLIVSTGKQTKLKINVSKMTSSFSLSVFSPILFISLFDLKKALEHPAIIPIREGGKNWCCSSLGLT